MSSNHFLFSLLVLTAPLAAGAQDAPVDTADLARRVAKLEEADAAAKAKVSVSAGEQGFALKTSDGAFVLKLRGLVQVDARAYPGDDRLPLTDAFVLRRARPTLDATFFDFIDLRLSPDFANSSVVLFDAWVDVRLKQWLCLQVGKFKPPLGLERLQGAAWTHFSERAAPSALIPGRELGIQVHGEIAGGGLSYAVGVFNGGVDGAINEADTNANKEIMGRLFSHPFRFLRFRRLDNFGVGVSASFGRQTGTTASPQLPSYRAPGQQTYFAYASSTFANGNRLRVSPQAYLYLGRLGLLAEYVSSAQSLTRFGNTVRVANDGWNLTVALSVTGEDASFDGPTPKRRFGALEVAARYHVLRVDNAAFTAGLASNGSSARRATSFGIGLSWYVNRNLRVNLDFDRTWFIGGAVPVPLLQNGDRNPENSLSGRAQVAF